MSEVILLDFGSTFTKAVVVDLKKQEIVYRAKEPSTVSTDAKMALDVLYEGIEKAIGAKAFSGASKLATSSAAGGLRMVVVGLTPTLSIAAGKNAAFSAGAKVLKTYSGALTEEDVRELETMNVEIILLLGGFEKGNVSLIRQNALMLGSTHHNVPVIYAGNSELIQEVRTFFYLHHKECFVIDNIIPGIGRLEKGPAQELIRTIFLQRIVNMKGLEKVNRVIDRIVMPTPAAVLEAGELLSKGYGEEPGLGNLMVVDVGGATTDVHTYCEAVACEGAKMIGAPEPYAKRTVEADLGMRESSGSLAEEAGLRLMADALGISESDLRRSLDKRMEHIEFLASDIPKEECLEKEIDQMIAEYACHAAVRRHCGTIEYTCSKVCSKIQRGKNLTEIATIVGTGGPIINSENPKKILQKAIMTEKDQKFHYMLPQKTKLMVDGDYVLYAAGILAQIDPKAALAIMRKSLKCV